MINHGTRSGYYAHRRQSEPPCDDCRKAINEYVRKYREVNGNNRDRMRETARRRAMAVLRDRYREEYEDIVEALEIEMAEENLL